MDCARRLRERFNLEVFLGPGAALVRKAGSLVSRVIDLFEGDNNRKGPQKLELVVSAVCRAIQNDTNAIATYSTGTIAIAADEVTVTGSGTTWTVAMDDYQSRFRYNDGSAWKSWVQVASQKV